jgi:hypothetical protein
MLLLSDTFMCFFLERITLHVVGRKAIRKRAEYVSKIGVALAVVQCEVCCDGRAANGP